MPKKSIRKPLSLAIGAAILSASGLAGAADTAVEGDLFTMDPLDTGQLMAGAHKEGGCGEGKCGEDKKGEGEGSCGEAKGEGSCGGST
jgi:uncharacterized low-complexity protein